jgi:hypothetical protein
MNNTSKIVVSNTLASADWQNLLSSKTFSSGVVYLIDGRGQPG